MASVLFLNKNYMLGTQWFQQHDQQLPLLEVENPEIKGHIVVRQQSRIL